MTGVLQGFIVIVTMIAVGFVSGQLRLLPDNGVQVLTRLVFFVMMPCLLLTVLVDADASMLFSSLLVVLLVAALACMALYALIARLAWRRRPPEVIIGALSSGFANSGNIGIPVSVYVLGRAAYTAPVIRNRRPFSLSGPASRYLASCCVAIKSKTIRPPPHASTAAQARAPTVCPRQAPAQR